MIFYLKYFVIAYLLVVIQSNVFFKGVLKLFIVPDFVLVYIFWLTMENKENIAKYVGLFIGIFLDLLNPEKTFINTFSYFFSTLYIINIKNKFIGLNFTLKLLAIVLFSLIVSIPKTVYSFFLSNVSLNQSLSLIGFYVLYNAVIIYFIYYFTVFVLKRDEI